MIGKFIGELKRRNVFRAAVLYGGGVWVISQGISELTGSLGLPEESTKWFMIASLIGFPFWLAASWFFELTAEGIKRESDISAEARAGKSNRKTDLMIIGVLAVAVVLLLTDRLVEGSGSASPKAQTMALDNSIAVLPFENESGDKEQQYFSDGLSEGFIIALSRLDGLRVINRKSSFMFRDSKKSDADIAAKLGVSHLLEGSVRRIGNTVRISATLSKSSDGTTLWADSFDRPYQDLFAVQDQIVAQVAEALKAKLKLTSDAKPEQSDRPPSGNLQAYDAYMQAHAAAATNARKAIALYDKAIGFDPKYGVAYAMKARALIDIVSGGLTGDAADQALQEAEQAVAQAQRLAPSQAATHIARGWLLTLRDFSWKEGEAEFRQAVALAPEDGDALYMLGVARASQGDLQQAVALTQRALKQDPLDANWYRWLVAYLMPLGQLDAASSALAKAIELEPNALYNHHLQTIIEVVRKDPAAAQKAAALEPAGPWQDFALALAAQIGVDRVAADTQLKACITRYPEGWAFQIAQLYAVRGEPDAMFEWLDRALKDHDSGMQSLLYDALLLRYRNDPRYAELAKAAGLPWPPETETVNARRE
ncbi:MAG: tetratricopeptide repeat protein [Thermomonas sp.]|uniref:tetratricopeptide repeat protein n=1 Tax=Thermomonas sp. TaxID=1971895 RepID=UPI001EB9EBE4|nr:tetratricopeptide repeat protein [Thermomonas sp.]MBV2208274.1 tetratricopeptide repeat protein [Thermomonas sp.]